MTIEDGENIFEPSVLIINAHGLENIVGLRKAHDGVVHFGSKRFIDENEQTAYNDYVFDKGSNDGFYSPFGERHFSISYDTGNAFLYLWIID